MLILCQGKVNIHKQNFHLLLGGYGKVAEVRDCLFAHNMCHSQNSDPKCSDR